MSTTKTPTTVPTTSQAVAPDDLRVGDYVTVAHRTYQLVPLDTFTPGDVLRPQTIRMIPDESGLCYRVAAVCLPFILTRSAVGGHPTLDVRQVTLRRLDKRFGKAAFAALDPKKRKDNTPACSSCAKRKKRKRKGKDGGQDNG